MRTSGIVWGSAFVCAAGGAALLLSGGLGRENRAAVPDLAWLGAPADVAPHSGAVSRGGRPIQAVVAFGQGPLQFEENRGQAAEGVRFLARGPRHTTFVRDDGFRTVVQTAADAAGRPDPAAQHAVRFRFVDGSPDAQVRTTDRQPTHIHYYVGRDASSWITDVPSWGRVTLEGVWPGIDVAYHGVDGRLEYDFLVAPGADPGRIAIDVEGADSLRVTDDGDLVVAAGSAEIRHLRPVAFQTTSAGRREVAGHFVLDAGGSRVRFRVDGRDPAGALVIDPVQAVACAFGGAGADGAYAVAAGPNGRYGFTGGTRSTDFGVPAQSGGTFRGPSEAFFTSMSTTTSTPLAISFVGGDGDEAGLDLVYNGNTVWAVGFNTSEGSFPYFNSVQFTQYGGENGAFLGFNPDTGKLRSAGGFGGSGDEVITSISVPPTAPGLAATSVVIGSLTDSFSIPRIDSTNDGGGLDALVVEIDVSGTLPRPTSDVRFGGPDSDDAAAGGVFLDHAANGDVFATFATGLATLLATEGSFGELPDGSLPAYVVHLETAPVDVIDASTYLNGTGELYPTGIDTLERRLIISLDCPTGTVTTTDGATIPSPPGTTNGAVFVLDQDLASAVHVTYAGGFGDTTTSLAGVLAATSTAGDPELFVFGTTSGGVSGLGDGAEEFHGATDVFVTRGPLEGGDLLQATNLGGTDAEVAGTFTDLLAGGGIAANAGSPIAAASTGQILVVFTTSGTSLTWPDGLGGDPGDPPDAILAAPPMSVAGTPVIGPTSTLADPFSDFVVLNGRVIDSPREMRDKVQLKFSFGARTDGVVLDPLPGGPGGLQLEYVSGSATSTALTTVVDLDAPFAEGWTKRGNRLFYRGEEFRVVLDLNRKNGTLTGSRLDVPLLERTPFGRVNVRFDDHEGTALCGQKARGPRNTTVTRTPRGLGGRLDLDEKVKPLGTPFQVQATLSNFEPDPVTVEVRIRHKGFPVFDQELTIPALDLDAVAPGMTQVTLPVAPPTIGRGQKFTLEAGGDLLVLIRATVVKSEEP